MTKQPKAVKAWAVWFPPTERPWTETPGKLMLVYENKEDAEAASDRIHWVNPSWHQVVPVLITPATPKKRRSKK